jgi:hypothetical protein
MKNIFILFVLFFLALSIQAQSDIVYTTAGDTIKKCRITEVSKGNIVVYTKKFKDYKVEAYAIKRNGIYMVINTLAMDPMAPLTEGKGLYRGREFEYYENIYINSMSTKNTGILLTFLGTTACVAGALTLHQNPNQIAGAILFMGGGLLADGGIALWIYGGIKSNNNRRAMQECKRGLNLTLGSTHDGFGFRLRMN